MALLETDLLLELVERKHQVLSDLHHLGQRQAALIRQEELSDLLQLLDAKQRLLPALQRIQQELVPYRDQLPDQRQWRTATDRQKCQQLLVRCQELYAAIVEQERDGIAQMSNFRDATARRLDGVQQAAHARAAYTSAETYTTGQLDLSSER